MGLGVLEDQKLEHVPGTNLVLENEADQLEPDYHEGQQLGLKYDTSGPRPIVLVPQPSDDPNDPLNWPLWKRDVILVVLSLSAVLATTMAPLLAATTITLALNFSRPFQEIALLTGYHLLAVGVSGLLFVPSARVYGKRHLYLLGTVIMIVGSVWAGASGTNFASIVWARVFQGVGLAPFETLVNASVGDLYPVHLRGRRMALSNLALFGGAFFTPVLVGKITADIGWEWPFYLVAIFAGPMLLIITLFVPETTFRREPDEVLIQRRRDAIEKLGKSGAAGGESSIGGSQDSIVKHTGQVREEGPSVVPRKATFLESLKPFNGRKTEEGYWNLFFRPFPLFLHPTVVWSCLIQGTLIGWTVLIGTVLAAILLSPPLFFNEAQTGYMYTGASIGAIGGFLLSGLLADWIPNRMTRANRGVYEPEFRLPLVAGQLVLGCIGLYGFGWTSNDVAQYGWFWPDFFFAFEVAGMVVGTVASALYIVDAHPDIAVEAFTCMIAFKNIFSYGLTIRGVEWIANTGPKDVFVIVGSVQVGVCMLTVPMYIFGKRNRSFWARHNVFFQISDSIAEGFKAPFRALFKRRGTSGSGAR